MIKSHGAFSFCRWKYQSCLFEMYIYIIIIIIFSINKTRM